jgi:hypothetical protein
MGKKYRFVWGKNGFCGAKKIMAIDDVKKVKTHDEPKVSNFRVYYEPPGIINPPTKSVGALFLGGFQPLFYHKVTSMYNEVIK